MRRRLGIQNTRARELLLTLFVMFVPVTARAQEEAPVPTDLLSWGAGAFAVRLETPAPNTTIRAAIDGSERTTGIGIPRREPLPHRFVVELPAPTSFETFAVPVMDEFGPARGRHVRTIRLEGSMEGPEAGFVPLVTLTLQLDQSEPQSFSVPELRPVRWLRVEFVDRLVEAPSDVDQHTFSELMGYGTQEPIDVPPDKFSGRWRYRRTGINDVPGRSTVELAQDGTAIRGCEVAGGQQFRVTGSIVDGLAQLTVTPEGGGSPIPVLANVTEEGELVGARFNAGYSDFWASPDPEATTGCMPTPAAADPITEALTAGSVAVIHGINFDVDSDVLRPDATPALERVLTALQATGDLAVTIEGHTDRDGTEEHNLELSQRRAEAVVAWLLERGIAPTRLRPVGIGEAQPIADNESSAGRALNRRVEVRPS